MSKLIPILLLCALILQTSFKVFIYLDYHVNKEIIIQKYCENKARPAMKCHGKCHLKKILSEDSKSDEQKKNSLKENFEISPYIQNRNESLISQSGIKSDANFLYILKKNEARTNLFFHPPSIMIPYQAAL